MDSFSLATASATCRSGFADIAQLICALCNLEGTQGAQHIKIGILFPLEIETQKLLVKAFKQAEVARMGARLSFIPNLSREILSKYKCSIASSLDILSTLTLVLASAFVKYCCCYQCISMLHSFSQNRKEMSRLQNGQIMTAVKSGDKCRN